LFNLIITGFFLQTFQFLHFQIAALSSGLLADQFGRRHVTMTCLLLLALSSLGMVFARNYEVYIVMSFLIAVGQAGNRMKLYNWLLFLDNVNNL
jgi:MFS family permease